MKHTISLALFALLIFAAALFAAPHSPMLHSSMLRSSSPSASGRVPVLVELFTSEGCSSCPPADALAARLEKTQSVPGADVVVMAHHVDYWNHLGWRDPYSSAAASARQSAYSNAFHLDSVYTPQAIVNGRTELVGSEEGQLTTAIARAAKQSTAIVDVTAEGNSATVRVSNLPKTGGDAQVLLAVTEDNLASSVARGENAGRRLRHTGVVRQLLTLGAAKDGATLTTKISLQSDWKRNNLRLVAFVQEQKSRRVLGVGAASL